MQVAHLRDLARSPARLQRVLPVHSSVSTALQLMLSPVVYRWEDSGKDVAKAKTDSESSAWAYLNSLSHDGLLSMFEDTQESKRLHARCQVDPKYREFLSAVLTIALEYWDDEGQQTSQCPSKFLDEILRSIDIKGEAVIEIGGDRGPAVVNSERISQRGAEQSTKSSKPEALVLNAIRRFAQDPKSSSGYERAKAHVDAYLASYENYQKATKICCDSSQLASAIAEDLSFRVFVHSAVAEAFGAHDRRAIQQADRNAKKGHGDGHRTAEDQDRLLRSRSMDCGPACCLFFHRHHDGIARKHGQRE